MSSAVARALEDYTVGELLAEIRSQEVSMVLTGTGNILALIGREMLDRIGERPDGKAEVTVSIDNDRTEVTIRWNRETREHDG